MMTDNPEPRSPHAPRSSPTSWFRPDGVLPSAFLWLAAGFGTAFVLFSVAVYLGLLDRVDRHLADWARPDKVWLTLQQRTVVPVDLFSPLHMVVVLAVVLVGVVVARRSIRPAVVPAVTGLLGGVAAVLTKFVVGRPDLGGLFYNGGSFPSGHVLTVVLVSGLVLLLIWPAPRWWHLVVPLVPGMAMSAAVVIIGMHWAGDAVGSLLLAESLLAAAAAWTAAIHRTGQQAAPPPPSEPAGVGGRSRPVH